MGRSQPGVGLWSPHFFVLHFFESGLTLNPHNKRHSFGLFISLYLCCVVDCINTFMQSTTQARCNDMKRPNELRLLGVYLMAYYSD